MDLRSSHSMRGLLITLALAALTAAPALAQTPASVGAVSPTDTLSFMHPAVTVPVVINRDAQTAMLGFSVRVQLSQEFAALNTNTDVAIGSFMTDKSPNTSMQVINNGNGSYTIDGVMLGTDCGPTAKSGTLFTLVVHSATGTGAGTVTVQSVTLRDCNNGTIDASPGSAASVVIDNTGPTVHLTAPNGGEPWVYQTTHDITWTADDPAGVAGVDLAYSTDGGASWIPIASGEANDGVYSWAIPNTPSTTALVRVTARDAHNNAASDASDATFTLLANTAPVLAPLSDLTGAEGTPISFTAGASDAESPPQTLTFSLTAAPTGATIDGATGVFHWTPGETDGGTAPTVTVRVTDNGVGALFDEKSFKITVSEVNSPPALDPIGNQTVDELTSLTFTAHATDPDIPANTLTYALTAPPPGAAIDPATGAFSWTPTEAQGPGDYSITVRVTDDGVPPLSDQKSFNVHVNEVNVAPAMSPVANQTGDELTPLTVTLAATDADLPAQILTFSLTTAPPGATILGNTISWTPTEAQGPGDYAFTARVTDSGSPALFDEKSFSVHVNEVNVAPVLSGVPASATIPELAPYGFTATATDADIPTQTLTFSLVGAPTGATIGASSGVFAWTPTEAQGPGTYAFKVQVSDGVANTDADITLTVTDVNSPPELTGVPTSPVTIPEMVLYTFQAHATDSDIPAQTLTFSLLTAPTGATIGASDGVFSWTPTEAQGPGDYTLTVRVSDGTANTDAPLTIHVSEVNIAPTLSGVPTGTVTIPELVAYGFTASASDPDIPTQTLTFSLSGAPLGATIGATSGVFAWTPTKQQSPGDYTFTVRVSDGVANTDVPLSIHVYDVTIAALTDLSATLVRSGNDHDGTMKVAINWTPTPEGTTVEVYRARYGFYPEFDDAGLPPATPGYPVLAPWEAVPGITAPGQTDEVNGPGSRDYWYYVAFVHGIGANVSGPSNRAGTPNYLLGDVSDGVTEGQGDNAVGTADISLLGSHYGLTGADVTPFDYLDVGPTSDRTGSGLPLTDNVIDFEDLVIFALNYGAATTPALAASAHRTHATAMPADRLAISAPDQVSAGQEFTVTLKLEGTGRVQALSAALDWKHGLVEPVGVEAGEWTSQLGGVVMSPRPGAADVALLGARGDGFAGQGVIAVIRFRALAAGDPQVKLATLTARDPANRDVALTSETTEIAALPSVTMLSAAYPNPFSAATTFALSLAQAGPVSVTVFSVDGRRVRTLATGPWQPGQYRLTWDGRDENGSGVAAGVYFVQLAAPQVRSTRRIVYLR